MKLTPKGRGALAYIHDKPLSANPHVSGSREYFLWQEGWLWGKREGIRRDSEPRPTINCAKGEPR